MKICYSNSSFGPATVEFILEPCGRFSFFVFLGFLGGGDGGGGRVNLVNECVCEEPAR